MIPLACLFSQAKNTTPPYSFLTHAYTSILFFWARLRWNGYPLPPSRFTSCCFNLSFHLVVCSMMAVSISKRRAVSLLSPQRCPTPLLACAKTKNKHPPTNPISTIFLLFVHFSISPFSPVHGPQPITESIIPAVDFNTAMEGPPTAPVEHR